MADPWTFFPAVDQCTPFGPESTDSLYPPLHSLPPTPQRAGAPFPPVHTHLPPHSEAVPPSRLYTHTSLPTARRCPLPACTHTPPSPQRGGAPFSPVHTHLPPHTVHTLHSPTTFLPSAQPPFPSTSRCDVRYVPLPAGASGHGRRAMGVAGGGAGRQPCEASGRSAGCAVRVPADEVGRLRWALVDGRDGMR
eukprot:366019-Chlamydomonas_euryale.AAC.6